MESKSGYKKSLIWIFCILMANIFILIIGFVVGTDTQITPEHEVTISYEYNDKEQTAVFTAPEITEYQCWSWFGIDLYSSGEDLNYECSKGGNEYFSSIDNEIEFSCYDHSNCKPTKIFVEKNESELLLFDPDMSFFSTMLIIIFFFALPFALICGFKICLSKYNEFKNYAIDTFYNKCIENKIYNASTPENIEKMLIIGKSFGFNTKRKVAKNFNLAKKHIATDEENQKKEELEEAKKAKNEGIENATFLYNLEKRQAKFVGKKQYLEAISIERAKTYKAYLELQRFDPCMFLQKHKKDNSSWVGGFTSGIAGPIAGAVEALKSSQKTAEYNAAVDKYNETLIGSGSSLDPVKLQDAKQDGLKKLDKKLKELESMNHIFQNLIIDDSNKEKYFKKLQIDITNIENLSYCLKLSVNVRVLEKIKILNTDAVIDGSLLIKVFDSNKHFIGQAYLNASEFTYKFTEMGFDEFNSYVVTAIPLKSSSFAADENFTFEILPNALWAVEI